MKDKSQLHAFTIPAKYFPACKIIRPFIARVIYSVKEDQVIIEDVGFSEKCLLHMQAGPSLMQEIRAEIEAAVKKRKEFFEGNKHVSEILLSALAPHI
jgi:hypothetical protein